MSMEKSKDLTGIAKSARVAAGVKGGRSVGKATGFKWMVDAKIEVE